LPSLTFGLQNSALTPVNPAQSAIGLIAFQHPNTALDMCGSEQTKGLWFVYSGKTSSVQVRTEVISSTNLPSVLRVIDTRIGMAPDLPSKASPK